MTHILYIIYRCYGKSVLRKRGNDGKLTDTNNSTNDFTPDSTPSLKK